MYNKDSAKYLTHAIFIHLAKLVVSIYTNPSLPLFFIRFLSKKKIKKRKNSNNKFDWYFSFYVFTLYMLIQVLQNLLRNL